MSSSPGVGVGVGAPRLRIPLLVLAFLALLFVHPRLLLGGSKVSFVSATELEGFSDELELEEGEEEEDPPAVEVPPPPPQFDGSKTELEEEEAGSKPKPRANADPSQSTRAPKRVKQEAEWDEDEFVGIPSEGVPLKPAVETKPSKPVKPDYIFPREKPSATPKKPLRPLDFLVEAFALIFLVLYGITYYLGKKENESIAFAWVKKFAGSEGTLIEKNFSLLGVGDGVKEPLLLKEGQNVFKFYASGRRFCEGMMVTLNLRSRQDLLSLLSYYVVPKRDTLIAEVLMNEDAMEPFALAVVKKKLAKSFQRENADLKGLGTVMDFKNRRNFPSDDLAVIGDSREAANEIISDSVVDQILAEKNLSDLFVSLHFTDQNSAGKHKKVLKFQFNLPPVDEMSQLSRLMSCIPYFIDSVGRFKLTSATKTKAEASRAKYLEEELKESQNMKYEQIQKRREEKRKQEEARKAELESRLTPEALARKREKESRREMKQRIPKPKITKVH